jgi:hypothetical protein
VILGEFYVTISLIIEVVLRLNSESNIRPNTETSKTQELHAKFWKLIDWFMLVSMIGCFSLLIYK